MLDRSLALRSDAGEDPPGSWVLRNSRAVAQLGSALDWGSRGRRFKSCQPDESSGEKSHQSFVVFGPGHSLVNVLSSPCHKFSRPRIGGVHSMYSHRLRSFAASPELASQHPSIAVAGIGAPAAGIGPLSGGSARHPAADGVPGIGAAFKDLLPDSAQIRITRGRRDPEPTSLLADPASLSTCRTRRTTGTRTSGKCRGTQDDDGMLAHCLPSL